MNIDSFCRAGGIENERRRHRNTCCTTGTEDGRCQQQKEIRILTMQNLF